MIKMHNGQKHHFVFTCIVSFCMILFVVVLIWILSNLRDFDEDEKIDPFPGSQNANLRLDCDVNTVYSVNDRECSSICQPKGTYISKNGICVNSLIFNETKVNNQCDPKKGVLAYLIGDPQFGKVDILCQSTDPGVQPNDISKPNTICQGGTIDINYLLAFPQAENCKCPDGQIPTLIPNTNSVRKRAVCVNQDMYPVFQLNNLLIES